MSKNDLADSCNEIRIGHKYALKPCSRLANPTEGPLAGLDLSLVRSSGRVTGFDYYGVTVRLEGDSITDLFTSKNLKGLCYLK